MLEKMPLSDKGRQEHDFDGHDKERLELEQRLRFLLGRTIVSFEVDEYSGKVQLKLNDGSTLKFVSPGWRWRPLLRWH
jgi:hypothetical protein